MSKVILNWNNDALELVLINQDGLAAQYRYRSDTEQVIVKIIHKPLKGFKGPRGTEVERHGIEVIHERFPTATELGARTKTYLVTETELSTPALYYNIAMAAVGTFARDADAVSTFRLGGVGDYTAST